MVRLTSPSPEDAAAVVGASRVRNRLDGHGRSAVRRTVSRRANSPERAARVRERRTGGGVDGDERQTRRTPVARPAAAPPRNNKRTFGRGVWSAVAAVRANAS